MEEDEFVILFACLGGAAAMHYFAGSARLHPLFLRNNPYPGVTVLGLAGGLAFTSYVLARFADASVTGIYVVFYLVMAYALTLAAGRFLAGSLGARFRVDLCERRNPAAALLHVAVLLAVGVIFGSCLWGEADPYSDDEGGWWIPVGFFLLGMGVFSVAMHLYARRERGGLRRMIGGERSIPAARAASTYALGLAWVVSGAVAGDFFGWAHGLAAIGQVVVLLVVHELFRLASRLVSERSRVIESLLYLAVGFGAPFALSFIPGWSDI